MSAHINDRPTAPPLQYERGHLAHNASSSATPGRNRYTPSRHRRKLKNHIRQIRYLASPPPRPPNPHRPDQTRTPHQIRVRCRTPVSSS